MSKKNGFWIENKWLQTQNIVAESSYMAVPYLSHSLLQNTSIIHVVRDPIKVVNSFVNYIDYFKSETPSNEYEKFIYNHLPEMKNKMPSYDRAALFVVMWNELIESFNPDFFYRVEDTTDKLLQYLNIQNIDKDMLFSDTSINTYQKWIQDPFELHKIESKEIRNRFVQLGRKYNYKMSNIYMI